MIKVQNKTATREPLPSFLVGLSPESLADLSWTDPVLGVSDAAWYNEENISLPLSETTKYDTEEVLTIDHDRKVVTSFRDQINLTTSEVTALVDSKKPQLIESNNIAYAAAINQMTSDYPPAEIQTWERQRDEVMRWSVDSTAETPWITLAAAARGLDRTLYLQRTLAKVSAFAQATAYFTGRRQGIDDAIRATKTLNQLSNVVIDYSLPG